MKREHSVTSFEQRYFAQCTHRLNTRLYSAAAARFFYPAPPQCPVAVQKKEVPQKRSYDVYQMIRDERERERVM